MKFLRGVPVVDKFDEKNLSYQGLSGQKYTLDFFLSAGLQMSTLRKVIQDSDFNILLNRLLTQIGYFHWTKGHIDLKGHIDVCFGF